MVKITFRRALIGIPIFMAVIVVAVWAFSYHPSEFNGGVGIIDSGLFYYPRYHAQLGYLPFWKNGEYQFTVRGLPPGPLDLTLQVMDASYADSEELTSSSTTLAVSIAENSQKEVCRASGNLADSIKPSSWVLTGGTDYAAFWHENCLELPISRFKTYTLRVRVSGVDNRSPHKMLRPALQGGGIELP
ncbi:MAG: hypothetical protein ACLQVG_13825 [Terriglobia bacterium]